MCTKKRFSSRPLAIQRIEEIKTRGEEREKTPIREYYCSECGGYHLTSKEIDKKKKQKIKVRKTRYPEKIAEHYIKKYKWE